MSICFEDEHYIWRGKEVSRKAGSSARGLLKSWIELRTVDVDINNFIETFHTLGLREHVGEMF